MSVQDLLERRKKVFLPTAQTYYDQPIELVGGSGCTVWDSQGNSYLDAFGGILCISSGHNHPVIKEALIKALTDNSIQHTSLLYLNRYAVEAAENLLKFCSKALEVVTFTNSGSEANELAMMMARNSTQSSTVLSLRHSYHGSTLGTLSQCGQAKWKWNAQPQTDSVLVAEPYCYRCPFGQKPTTCDLECAKDVEKAIQTSTCGKVAALIVEPVLGVGGFITPPDSYFKEVDRIVHAYGGKLIVDEVQTGVGRGGKQFFVSDELGLRADYITMAKGLSNGASVGAVVCTKEQSQKFTGKMYLNTFAADPLQMLQTKLNLQIVADQNLIQNAGKMRQLLRVGLEEISKKYTQMGEVRGRGLMQGIEVVSDRISKKEAPDLCSRVMEKCKKNGLLVGRGGLGANVIRIAPPLSIQAHQVAELLAKIDQAFFEIQ